MMTVQRCQSTLVQIGTWVASQDIEITLPNTGAITRVEIDYQLTALGILASDTNNELTQWKPIQSLQIKGSSGHVYVGANGEQMGRLLHFLNQLDFPGYVFGKAMTTNTVYGKIVLHFGTQPRDGFGRDNPFDMSAFIPARDELAGGLKLILTTTQAADIVDTSIDISAGTFNVTVYEVLGVSMSGNRPRSQTVVFPHVANVSSPGVPFDVPTGAYLRRIALLSQDDTAIASGGPLLAGDEIGRVLLGLPKAGRRIVDLNWDAFGPQLPRIPAMTAAGAVTKPIEPWNDGFRVLDLRQHGDPKTGLALQRYQTGDMTLGLVIQNFTSGDDTIIYYDMVEDYVSLGG